MENEKLYWRTHAGFCAWSAPDSGLPGHYRRILGVLHSPLPVKVLRRRLGGYSERELCAWLDELDTLGFVQTGRAAAAYYPEAA
jgi:hypothetical protein